MQRSDKIIMVIRMKWEELNVLEFSLAVKKACGVVLVPIGCLEKHGNHMPIGTDIILAREISLKVSMEEDVMVFPFMPFGVVGEVKHKFGTISLSSHLLYQVLEELCDELARNGFNKIIFVDGHGGNYNFLKYFMQSRLEKYHNYVTYYFDLGQKDSLFWKEYQEEFGRVLESGHACEFETSSLMDINSDLVNLDVVNPLETISLGRLDYLKDAGLYTGISWYADYPNQIAGDPSNASIERGKWINERNVKRLVNAVRVVKDDNVSLKLLEEYYSKFNKCEK